MDNAVAPPLSQRARDNTRINLQSTHTLAQVTVTDDSNGTVIFAASKETYPIGTTLYLSDQAGGSVTMDLYLVPPSVTSGSLALAVHRIWVGVPTDDGPQHIHVAMNPTWRLVGKASSGASISATLIGAVVSR